MNKVLMIRCLVFFAVGFLFLYSCVKDKGKPIPAPFSFQTIEGFEGSASLPSGWTLYNPNNDAAWQVVTTVAHTGNKCVGFNNCDGNGTTSMTGRKDRLITPAYDFSKATSVSISFDVAYAVLNFKNQTFYDSLAVYSSINGGSTWTRIYINGGDGLTNIPTITTSPPCWAPSFPSDWRTDFINVNNLSGKPKVMFAFENISDWGEWIYIDNIKIVASNGANNCSGVTYLKDIQPIIQNECATAGCHIPGGTGPTDLTTFTGVKAIADNGEFKKRAIDGNPSFMPTSGKLPDSMIDKIRCWLNDGAPNN